MTTADFDKDTCMGKLDLGPLPALVDDMQDTANKADGAWPDCLYLIGKNGKLAYKGGPGPWGFKPSDLESAIRVELQLPQGKGSTPP